MGIISSNHKGKLYTFFYAYKYDSGSLPYLLIDDVMKIIIDFRILIEYCIWIELKPYFWSGLAYSINKNYATLIKNKNTSYIYTPFARVKFKPLWTIIKNSKDTSGYFQIACMCGSTKKEILDNILSTDNFYSMPKGILGMWSYRDFGLEDEQFQLTIDPFNKRFLINDKSYEFQYTDVLWSINTPNLVCVVIMTNNHVPVNSSAIVVNFKYQY